MCSALYFYVFEVLRLATAPLGGAAKALQTRYPFNFVVKHRVPIAVLIGASPGALKTLSHPDRDPDANCFLAGVAAI